ncbi:flagellar FlbD family protein [Granulicella sp. dw_53]|uniref:flagellar FlbD family protein n=1 Tax=Granulicella sp. dw_53 TaxID=2719792 RepID=UPI001BD666EE|nr:flagellar FlbD family protein [Granulicella sp. dw_53]
MIQLTRLNGSRLDVNCDLIKYAEASPDTVLTLVTGEKLVVLESCDEVSRQALIYRAAILREAWPEASPALTAKASFDAHRDALDQATEHSR